MRLMDYLKGNEPKNEGSKTKTHIDLISLARRSPRNRNYLAALLSCSISAGDMNQAKIIASMIRNIKDGEEKTQ